jgi:hypothetical protein
LKGDLKLGLGVCSKSLPSPLLISSFSGRFSSIALAFLMGLFVFALAVTAFFLLFLAPAVVVIGRKFFC